MERTHERIRQVAKEHGLEAGDDGSVVWHLALRVVQAEALLAAAEEALTAQVTKTAAEAMSGQVRLSLDGMPWNVTSRQSAAFDAAVMRLNERREALRVVGQVLGRARSSS